MGTLSEWLALCEGNLPVTGGFPSRKPVTRSLDVSLICDWRNGWANNRDAGDLIRHRPHCDVIVLLRNTNRPREDQYNEAIYMGFIVYDITYLSYLLQELYIPKLWLIRETSLIKLHMLRGETYKD